MIETSSRRTVEHKFTAVVTDEHQWREKCNGYSHKGAEFMAETVRWPAAYSWSTTDAPTEESKVTVSGAIFNSDGRPGKRIGTADMLIRDLPEPVAKALLAEVAEVWKP